MRIFIKTIILSTILSSSVATVHAGGAGIDVDRLLNVEPVQQVYKQRQAGHSKQNMAMILRYQSMMVRQSMEKNVIRKANRKKSK